MIFFKLSLLLASFASLVTTQGFNNFRTCLTDRSFRREDIVRRSTAKTYTDLNYQFRLNPPYPRPRAYILPTRERDVISAVTCGRQNDIRVVPRCGGHQYAKFAYGDDESVVIDLRKINTVSVADGRATIGGGSILGPTSWRLWRTCQCFFPVGLCPMVGISGLALGGGHGYFTRRFGLTTDYIDEMNIVTAAGAVMTVNANTNSDLFWALRGGGGGSFGIVTRFIFRIIKSPERIFEGILIYNLRSFPEVFNAWQEFHLGSSGEITPNFRVRNGSLELHFFDSTFTSDTFRRIESRFPTPRSITTATYNYTDFIFYTSTNFGGTLKPEVVLKQPSDLGTLTHGLSKPEHIKTKSFFVPKLLERSEVAQFYNLLKELPTAVRCRFESYGGAVNDVEPNATTFWHRAQNGYNARATVDYQMIKDPAENRTARSWLIRFFNFGRDVFLSSETYQNYPDVDMRNFLTRYYGGNLRKLISIKRKYDPDNYFWHRQSIPVSQSLVLTDVDYDESEGDDDDNEGDDDDF